MWNKKLEKFKIIKRKKEWKKKNDEIGFEKDTDIFFYLKRKINKKKIKWRCLIKFETVRYLRKYCLLLAFIFW